MCKDIELFPANGAPVLYSRSTCFISKRSQPGGRNSRVLHPLMVQLYPYGTHYTLMTTVLSKDGQILHISRKFVLYSLQAFNFFSSHPYFIFQNKFSKTNYLSQPDFAAEVGFRRLAKLALPTLRNIQRNHMIA